MNRETIISIETIQQRNIIKHNKLKQKFRTIFNNLVRMEVPFTGGCSKCCCCIKDKLYIEGENINFNTLFENFYSEHKNEIDDNINFSNGRGRRIKVMFERYLHENKVVGQYLCPSCYREMRK